MRAALAFLLLLLVSGPPLTAQETLIIAADEPVAAFACVEAGCERLAWLPDGARVSVIGPVEGRELEGSTGWVEVLLDCPCFDYERINLQDLPPLQEARESNGFHLWRPVFSPTGDRIATVIDGHLYIWEAASGIRLVQTWLDDMHTGALAWSPDGTHIVVGGHTHEAPVRNLLLLDARGWVVSVLDGQAGRILDVAWSPNGASIAAVGDELRIWDVQVESPLVTVAVSASNVAWSPTDETLLLAGGEMTGDIAQGLLQIREGSSGALLNELASACFIADAAWSPHGTHIAWNGIGEECGGLFVWDLVSQEPSASLTTSLWPIAIDWSPDGNFLVANVYLSGQILDAEDGRVHAALVEVGDGLVPGLVDWSPDGRRIALSGYDSTGFRANRSQSPMVERAAWVWDLTLIPEGPTRAFIHSGQLGND
ncbi:MAG: WD40 repeat domain-containing protein [Anaerolineaceae bacterium]|nr:WD40 repeat domain-containing protein [Anaerolineaceae bacterium]